jgi:S-DNA-T family DNA segregation ATPase FtsK/SpoIIIE
LGAYFSLSAILGISYFFLNEKAGLWGFWVWQSIAYLLTPVGAFLILLTIFLSGIIIFTNTSLDWLLSLFLTIFQKAKIFSERLLTKKEKKVRIGGEEAKITPQISKESVSGQREAVQIFTESQPPTVNLPVSGQIWRYPPLSLLSDTTGVKADRGDLKATSLMIEKTLAGFGISGKVVEINLGPAITQYAISIPLGTKISKITALANDLALALATPTGTVRIEAPIPAKSLIGIEIPNRSLEIVGLKSILASDLMQSQKSKLAVALGQNVAGEPVVADIAKMPHVLIAGTTGSGKSVLLNSFLASILFRAAPFEVKMIMVDPKRVELSLFNGIPHLLAPVIVDMEKILSSLKWALIEMERRYKLFAQAQVRNIQGYNEMVGFQALPYILILVDELHDLMNFAPVEVEDAICRIAQMARATGIHLVAATQRPSVDVITGLIKANIPCRIAFNVSSMVDSRVIIDQPGAEKLLGRGDMLYLPPDVSKPQRIQGVFVSEEEMQNLIGFLKESGITPEYTAEVTETPYSLLAGRGLKGGEDELFEEAVRTVCQYDRASASLLQRRLRIGYARAARLLDQLEAQGIVGPGEGAKPRDVLVRNAEEFLSSRTS